MKWLRELLGFTRFKVAVSAVAMALASHFFLLSPSLKALPLALSTFFFCSAAYADNSLTDRKEDLLYRGRLNHFVRKGHLGKVIVLILFVLSALLASLTSRNHLLVVLLVIPVPLIYNHLRLKKLWFLKNIYTAAGFGIAAIYGSIGTSKPFSDILFVTAIITLMIMGGSLISDLRDFRSDRKAGVITLPVRIGKKNAQCLVPPLLLLPLLLIAAKGAWPFLVLFPSQLSAAYAARKNLVVRSWKSIWYGLISLPFATLLYSFL